MQQQCSGKEEARAAKCRCRWLAAAVQREGMGDVCVVVSQEGEMWEKVSAPASRFRHPLRRDPGAPAAGGSVRMGGDAAAEESG